MRVRWTPVCGYTRILVLESKLLFLKRLSVTVLHLTGGVVPQKRFGTKVFTLKIVCGSRENFSPVR